MCHSTHHLWPQNTCKNEYDERRDVCNCYMHGTSVIAQQMNGRWFATHNNYVIIWIIITTASSRINIYIKRMCSINMLKWRDADPLSFGCNFNYTQSVAPHHWANYNFALQSLWTLTKAKNLVLMQKYCDEIGRCQNGAAKGTALENWWTRNRSEFSRNFHVQIEFSKLCN